jgi:hypothetical protein
MGLQSSISLQFVNPFTIQLLNLQFTEIAIGLKNTQFMTIKTTNFQISSNLNTFSPVFTLTFPMDNNAQMALDQTLQEIQAGNFPDISIGPIQLSGVPVIQQMTSPLKIKIPGKFLNSFKFVYKP